LFFLLPNPKLSFFFPWIGACHPLTSILFSTSLMKSSTCSVLPPPHFPAVRHKLSLFLCCVRVAHNSFSFPGLHFGSPVPPLLSRTASPSVLPLMIGYRVCLDPSPGVFPWGDGSTCVPAFCQFTWLFASSVGAAGFRQHATLHYKPSFLFQEILSACPLNMLC